MTLIATVQKAVARHYGMTQESMVSRDPRRTFAYPRQVAMFLAREMTHHSLPVIGHWFSRHHTTVLHAIRTIESRQRTSVSLRRDLNALRKRLLP